MTRCCASQLNITSTDPPSCTCRTCGCATLGDFPSNYCRRNSSLRAGINDGCCAAWVNLEVVSATRGFAYAGARNALGSIPNLHGVFPEFSRLTPNAHHTHVVQDYIEADAATWKLVCDATRMPRMQPPSA